MKNLANCKPSEFLKQTIRIKRNVESWITSDDVKEIRKRMPDLEKTTDGMTESEMKEVVRRNQQKIREQSMTNLLDILEVLMDKKADETLSVLALCCFVEPENVDDYPLEDYLGSVADLLENENVLRFFGSLMRLGQTSISIASKK